LTNILITYIFAADILYQNKKMREMIKEHTVMDKKTTVEKREKLRRYVSQV